MKASIYNNGIYGFRINNPIFNPGDYLAVNKYARHLVLIRDKVLGEKMSKMYMVKNRLSEKMPIGWYVYEFGNHKTYYKYVGNDEKTQKRYGF